MLWHISRAVIFLSTYWRSYLMYSRLMKSLNVCPPGVVQQSPIEWSCLCQVTYPDMEAGYLVPWPWVRKKRIWSSSTASRCVPYPRAALPAWCGHCEGRKTWLLANGLPFFLYIFPMHSGFLMEDICLQCASPLIGSALWCARQWDGVWIPLACLTSLTSGLRGKILLGAYVGKLSSWGSF